VLRASLTAHIKPEGLMVMAEVIHHVLLTHTPQVRERANTLVERRRGASAVDAINNPIGKTRAETWAGPSNRPIDGEGGGEGGGAAGGAANGAADGAAVEEHPVEDQNDPWHENGRRFK